MMAVKIPSSELDSLKHQLENMKDMSAAVFETEDMGPLVTPSVGWKGVFLLEGADNPGLVFTVTAALANAGLNIDKMVTEHEIAPHGGTELFRMHGVATAPGPLAKGFDLDKIKKDMEALGESLNCDVSLEDEVDESASGSFYAG
jgi:glycine cleavage system regulatory protein